MKSFAVLLVLIAALENASAFGGAFTGSKLSTSVANSGAMTMEYIPSGMSKAQWQKMKEAEKNKLKGKNLGKTGITTFKSRSFSEWQKAGGKNLFPVDPRTVKDPKDIPYMQRVGGQPDDSDLKKGGGLGSFFAKKKKVPEPEPEPQKKNWWTL